MPTISHNTSDPDDPVNFRNAFNKFYTATIHINEQPFEANNPSPAFADV